MKLRSTKNYTQLLVERNDLIKPKVELVCDFNLGVKARLMFAYRQEIEM
jgi:hypothetical protein